MTGISSPLIVILIVLLIAATCMPLYAQDEGQTEATIVTTRDRLMFCCEAYWEFQLRTGPERATYLGDHRYDDRLTDYSAEARDAELEFLADLLKRLDRVEPKDLTEADRLTLDLLRLTLTDRLEMAEFPEHLMPIKQQDSPHITLGTLQATQPLKDLWDCDKYNARLVAFAGQVNDVIAAMDEGIAKGVVRPKVTIEQSLPQIEAMIAANEEDSVLYAPGKALPDSAWREKARERMKGATRVATKALVKLRDYLKNDYLPKCRETVGYCDLPNGKAWYRRAAKLQTTTDLSPEVIHEIGLSELKRIRAEMEKIAKEVGHTGDLDSFINKLRSDPARHNKTAEEIMRRNREILAKSDANLPKMFGKLPKIPYDFKEIEQFRAPGAPAAYYYNAPDDLSRPAYFYVNVYKPESRPIYTMEVLAYHEAMPGHHLQIALAQERKDWPDFRRFEHINAFIEGWALYSELLGYDLGGYQDPYSRFGQLTFDTWRSSRLVVDTGMHYFGWSRQKAIDFMKANTALSEQDIVSEIDRYIAWPGQALGYKIGQLEILKLRKEAEEKLGKTFDIREFHDHILAEGSIPLSTLRKRMETWMDLRINNAR
ncbi:MAG: DUF885 domain-containing protein [Planctomycetes bacterium]|nr:DUF885 domain-containing protein [Planctomycetota bacterium]